VESGRDGGVFVGGVFKLHHCHRHAVDEQHYVRSAFVLVLDYGKLIDREKVVVLRLIVIEHPDEIAANRAVGPLVLDRHPLDQVLVNHMVVRDQ